MSAEVEDDEEDGATQMMSSSSLVGDATSDALDEEEGDLTVPFDRGKAFAKLNARPRPAAGMPAQPRTMPYVAPPIARPMEPVVHEVEPDLETGSITVPVARDELPLPSAHEFGDTGEMTVPRRLAPQAAPQRQAPQYDLPPPAYRPPPVQSPSPALHAAANEPTRPQVRRPGSIPPPAPSPFMPPPQSYAPQLAQMPTPPPQSYAPQLGQMPTPPPQPYVPQLAQMATPPPLGPGMGAGMGPGMAPAPSSRGPSLPSAKTRSPPVFIAVMVACTVLTITGLVLLVYLKMRHFW